MSTAAAQSGVGSPGGAPAGLPAAPSASPWADARPLTLFARRLSDGLLAGQYRSIFRGSGQEVEELREYVEGDDPRTIDAGVTARLGRPFVKRFVDERQSTLLFVLDRSRSMATGGHARLYDAALLTLASLARAAALHHDRVGLVLLGQSGASVLPPSAGRGAARRALDAALAVAPDQIGADWDAGLRQARALLSGRGLVVLLSDFLEGFGGLERGAGGGQLGGLIRRHELLAVRFTAAEQRRWAELPAGTTLRLIEPETGRIRFLDQAAGAALVAALERSRQAFALGVRRLGVDLLDVELSAEPLPKTVARALLQLNAARRARGRRR